MVALKSSAEHTLVWWPRAAKSLGFGNQGDARTRHPVSRHRFSGDLEDVELFQGLPGDRFSSARARGASDQDQNNRQNHGERARPATTVQRHGRTVAAAARLGDRSIDSSSVRVRQRQEDGSSERVRCSTSGPRSDRSPVRSRRRRHRSGPVPDTVCGSSGAASAAQGGPG